MIDNRKHNRFELVEDVMFSRRLSHPYCYYGGASINHSSSGICLASRYDVVPGDSLCLRMIGSHLHSGSTVDELTCFAEVKWCAFVRSSKAPLYCIGLSYSGQVPDLFKPRHFINKS